MGIAPSARTYTMLGIPWPMRSPTGSESFRQDRRTTKRCRRRSALRIESLEERCLLAAISDAAYPLLTQRATAGQTSFFVYRDADSASNHGFPSGFFGAINKIQIDPACIDDPTAPNGCSTDPNRLDRDRGNI